MPYPEDDYVSDWPMGTQARSSQPLPPMEEDGTTGLRSVQPIMSDGQLGAPLLAEGPEYANPEGSVDISNSQYYQRTMRHR